MRRGRLGLVVAFAALLCAALLAALASCSKESPPPGLSPPPVNPVVVDALIGPEGGTLTHPAGAKIVVPPGALTAPTRVTLGGIAAPGADVLGSDPLAQAFQAGPEGQVFLKPVDVYVPFDPTRLAPGSDAKKNVQMRMAAHGSTSFAALHSSVDLAARTVRASTVHFTDFVPAAASNAVFITSDPTLPQATVGVAYAQQLTATGGTGPYTWTATVLPAGLALAPAGAISGAPTAPGASSFFVTASDSASHAVALVFTLSVVPAAANPVPVLNQISPASAVQGSPDKPITLLGAGFVPASQALFDGTALATTFRDATTLSATIPASAFVNFGNHTVSVTSPAPGGGTSASLAFTVMPSALNPVPTIASVSPAALPIAQTDASITITGTNFISTSSAVIGSQAIPTSYVSGTQLNATVPASYLAVAGTLQIGVRNPPPGGGDSATTVPVVVATPNPVPTLTSLSPSSVAAGSSDFTLSATGTAFVAGGKLFFGNTALATTVASATSASATVPASLVSAAGAMQVTFVNPLPGGGTSGSVAFQVAATDAGADSGPLDGGAGCSKLFGDPANQVITTLAIDNQGSAVVSGWFEWTTDFGGGPVFAPSYSAAVVAKFDSNCNHLWSVRLDDGTGIGARSYATVDPSGSVFVAVTLMQPGLIPYGVALTKIDPLGNVLFTKHFTGDYGEEGWSGLVSDRNGGVIATGQGPITFGDAGSDAAAANDSFVVAFDANGSVRWVTGDSIVTRTSWDPGDRVPSVDSTGKVIIAAVEPASDGGAETALQKLDTLGGLVWSRTWGSNLRCTNSAVAGNDDIFLACSLTGSIDIGTGTMTSAGEGDAVLVRVSGATGATLWAKRYGGPYNEALEHVTIDPAGNLVATGVAGSGVTAVAVPVDVGAGAMTTSPGDPNRGMTSDNLLARYDANGTPLSSALYGDSQLQGGDVQVAVAPSGEVVLAGGILGDVDFGQGLIPNVFRSSKQAFLARSPGQAAPIPGPVPCDAGTCPELIIPVPSATAITMNSTTIFWLLSPGNTIQSCPKTGCSTPTTVMSGAQQITGIAANDQYLFWGLWGAYPQPTTENVCSLSGSGDCVSGTAAVLYSQPNTPFFNYTLGAPVLNAIDVYFTAGTSSTSNTNVIRCPQSGCASPTTVISGSSAIIAFQPTSNGVYWMDQTHVAGPGFSYPLAFTYPSGYSIVTDGVRIFFSATNNDDRNGPSVVLSCLITGCGTSLLVLGTGIGTGNGVATDGVSLYWLGPDAYHRCPLTGCPPRTPDTVSLQGPPGLPTVLIDGSYVYRFAPVGGAPGIYRAPK